MSEECNHVCEGCPSAGNCQSNPQNTKAQFRADLNPASRVDKVIGVVSGKGGVGKSMVTSLLAIAANKAGHTTAILDADITGPSIPRTFGLKEKAVGTENAIYPVPTSTGIQVMSINLLLERENDPVVWRGPIIGETVKQFWSDVLWKDVNVMFIDMPPGTGDVPLTVYQSLPLDGIIIVTSPQELVSMIVGKAVNMAALMEVPILGIVENMSYVECPDCGKHIQLFGESHLEETALQYNLRILDRLPIDPQLARACDQGTLELYGGDLLKNAVEAVEKV